MRSASLEIVKRLIREYKRELQIRFFTNLILVSKMKGYQCCSLLVICLLCLIQGKIDIPQDERNFVPYEALCWMANSRNASGIEWWKFGTYIPKMYSWQPNHKDRGKLYTKKPRLPVEFGSHKSNRTTLAKAIASKRQQAFTIHAARNMSTKPIVNRFPPIIPHRISEPYHPFQDAGCHDWAKVNATFLVRDSTCKFAEQRALRERRQITPDTLTELGLSEEQFRDLKARVNR